MARTFALAIPATWKSCWGGCCPTVMHRFLRPARCRKTPEKRCRQWCRGARIGAIQFSSYCHSFPLFALLTAEVKATDTGQKPGPINAKKPRENSGFRGKTLHFEASCRSGETEFEPWVPVRALRFSRPVHGGHARDFVLSKAVRRGWNLGVSAVNFTVRTG
jgi:hypothetical protein